MYISMRERGGERRLMRREEAGGQHTTIINKGGEQGLSYPPIPSDNCRRVEHTFYRRRDR